MTRNGPFVSFCPFWPGFGLSGLCLAFLTLYITWLFAKKMSFVFSRRTVNMVYKRVCRNCPISSCRAKYLVQLANHLAHVHPLDHIQRRQYLQEAKLQEGDIGGYPIPQYRKKKWQIPKYRVENRLNTDTAYFNHIHNRFRILTGASI